MEEEGCLIGGQKGQGRMNLVNLDAIVKFTAMLQYLNSPGLPEFIVATASSINTGHRLTSEVPHSNSGMGIESTTKGWSSSCSRARAQRLRSYGIWM